MQCKYGREKEVEYVDKEGKIEKFECQRDAAQDEYCIFHHPEYWKEHPAEVREKFYTETRSALAKNEDVVCIGHNLPDINIKELGVNNFEFVSFQHCKFQEADFGGATFHEKTRFVEANFQEANFWRAIFQEVDFGRATFQKMANFDGATFQEAKFGGTTFQEGAEFVGAIFQKMADFTDVSIKSADFSYSVYEDIAVFINEEKDSAADQTILFHLVRFKNPKNVTFIDFPLSSVSFLMTDVRDILIISKAEKILSEMLLNLKEENEEIKEPVETEPPGERFHGLMEEKKETLNEFEKAIERLGAHLTRETVLAEYRNIRKSFENNRTFNEASELFVREMRLLRKNLEPHEKIVHWLYDGLSNYGESFKRPLLISIIIIFGVPAILLLIYSPNLSLDVYTHYLISVLRAFFQLGIDYKGLEIWLRVSSIILLGSMFIALRRRLERK